MSNKQQHLDVTTIEDSLIISYGEEKVIFKTDDNTSQDDIIKLINIAKTKFVNSFKERKAEWFMNEWDKSDDARKRYLYHSLMYQIIEEQVPYVLKGE